MAVFSSYFANGGSLDVCRLLITGGFSCGAQSTILWASVVVARGLEHKLSSCAWPVTSQHESAEQRLNPGPRLGEILLPFEPLGKPESFLPFTVP